jgi:hypothetical protein
MLSSPNVLYFFALVVVPICWYLLLLDSRSNIRRKVVPIALALGIMTLYFSVEASIARWSWFMFPLHDKVGASLFMLTPVIFLGIGVVGVLSWRLKLGSTLIVSAVTYISWWIYVIRDSGL